ncbi:NAD(P)-binding protein [Pleurostoma richardsiae]|uniref:NAD(P)-binding protein n=1 Tax=Pleurostoma richardsiae TaxID=41990 RepID=A0AA38R7H6_9PEZI|nr:NAD(P)-binding protein [Pleurostoma richardsiae]
MPANYSSDKLLLTVAGSSQGQALLSQLAGKWKNLRLGVHSEKSAAKPRSQYPDAEIVEADLDNVKAVQELVKGVNVIFHLGPSFHSRETYVGLRVVDAAAAENRRQPGVIKHFVFSSVIGTQLHKLLNHDCKRPIEEALMESGLPYTILQPTHRMDMLPLKAILGQESPGPGAPLVFKASWKPENKMSFVTLRDQTEAAKVVLEEQERHFYATYQLVSTPSPIPYTDFVKRAVAQAGREVEVGYKGFEESVAFYLDMLFGGEGKASPEVRDGLERMLLYYNDRGLWGSSNHLEWLLGRKGETVEEWARGQLTK